MLHEIGFVHDQSEVSKVWAYSYTSDLTCILPDGFAEALQGLYPGGHCCITVLTQTFYDNVSRSEANVREYPPRLMHTPIHLL